MTIENSTHSVIDSHIDRISCIEFWDNAIICIKLKEGIHIELEDVKAQRRFFSTKYNGYTKHFILVETAPNGTISKEAREFSAKPEINSTTKATAIISNSLADRIIINFIVKFTKNQPVKMKMFDNKQKAMNWLLSFKQY